MEETRARFPSEAAFRAEAGPAGARRDRPPPAPRAAALGHDLCRRTARSASFVSVDDIARYYDEELLPEPRQGGAGAGDIPTLDSVRESIRAVLRERRLNDEVDRWTADLRAKADVVDYLDHEPRELPPVVE